MNDREQYDALQRINWSKLRLLEKSPAHYKHGFGDDSSGFALGTASHTAVLESARFAAEYVVYPGRRAGKAWDAFEEENVNNGKSILNQKEYDSTVQIRNAVHGHAHAMKFLTGGASEQTLQWQLGEFKCKGRADYINPLAITDLKSTKDCSPKAFARACMSYGYFGQAAWYSDGLFLSRGVRLPYYIVAVESAAPYLVTVYRIPEHVIDYGREQYLTLLGKLDYCQQNNFWGGYTTADELDIELPDWVTTQTSTSPPPQLEQM